MKKSLLILSLLILLLSVNFFSYAHVFTWQDFEDSKTGNFNAKFFESNDNGKHGSNDIWGPNDEFTWPDEPGDTNIYVNSYYKPLIVKENGSTALKMNAAAGKNSFLFFENLPTNPKKSIELMYDFYFDNPLKKDNFKFTLFSSGSQDNKKSVVVEYENGIIKVIQGRNILLEKSKKLENRWYYFRIRVKGTEFMIYLNNALLCEGTTPFDIDFPQAFFGLKQSSRDDFFTNYYIDNICVWHRE